MSELKNICAALLKARADFQTIHKNKTGQARGGKYAYADLGSVLEAVEPALTKQGLLLSQPPSVQPGGVMMVSTTLIHVQSGESLGAEILLPGDLTAQELGSWITYGRRYTLCGLLGIVADEDDDGAAATGKRDKPAAKPKPGPPDEAPPRLSAEQVKRLWDLARLLWPDKAQSEAQIKALLARHGVTATASLDPERIEDYVNELDAAKAQGE